jgi:hypothetical protein
MRGRQQLIGCSAIVTLLAMSGCSLFADRLPGERLARTAQEPIAHASRSPAALSSGGVRAVKQPGAAVTAPADTASKNRSESPTTAPEPVPASLRGAPAPTWQVGDHWSFRWESAQGQGEYTWTVARIEALDGAPHYVVKAGDREIYIRVRDLATSLETRSGAVELRHTPPRMSYSWPLTPGTMWRQSLTEWKGPDTEAADRTIAWKIEDEERISVGAGAFETLKIVARHDHHKSEVMYEMWYAPEAKQWVRLREHFPSGIRYREMTELALAR